MRIDMAVLYDTTLRMADELNPSDALSSVKTIHSMREELRTRCAALFSEKKDPMCEVCGYKIEGNHFFNPQHKAAITARIKLEQLKNEFGGTTRDENERLGMTQFLEKQVKTAGVVKSATPSEPTAEQHTSPIKPPTPAMPKSTPSKRGRSRSRSRSRSGSRSRTRSSRRSLSGSRTRPRRRSLSRLGNRAQSFSRSRSRSRDRPVVTPKKKRLCRFFKSGFCKRGDACFFRHEIS